MRCGQHYEGDFDASLNQNSYAACTKQAIYKFLEGFTNWGGEYSDSGSCGLVVENQMDWKHGWAHWFSGGSHLELLIK